MDTKNGKRLVNILLLLWSMRAALCRICGSDFEDIQSRVLLSDLVAEGTVEIKYAANRENGRYNASVGISKILKGSLDTSNKRRRGLGTVRIGEFGPMDKEQCLIPVTDGQKYIFFLRPTRDKNYFKHAHLPESSSKQALRQIRGILCKGCAKPPTIKKFEDIIVEEGEKVQIKCRVRGMPRPLISWHKNGKVLKKKKGILIRNTRKGSTIRIRKAKITDAGDYECIARNALQLTKEKLFLAVESLLKTTEDTSTPTPSTTTITSQKPESAVTDGADLTTEIAPTGHYYPCEKQTYCLNGGTCIYLPAFKAQFCRCPPEYTGTRCESKDLFVLLREIKIAGHQHQDRIITILGIVIGLLVLTGIFIGAYCKAKKRRKAFRKRQEWKKKVRESLEAQSVDGSEASNFPNPDHGKKRGTSKPNVMRLNSTTQTEAINISDFLPSMPGVGNDNLLDASGLSVMNGDRGARRPRLNGLSAAPKYVREENSNFQTVPVVVESEPGSKDSTPSQSSKTESALRWPHSVGKEESNSRAASVNDLNHSDYENMDSDLENQLSCVPPYTSMESQESNSGPNLKSARGNSGGTQTNHDFSTDIPQRKSNYPRAKSDRGYLETVSPKQNYLGGSYESGGKLCGDEHGKTPSNYGAFNPYNVDANKSYVQSPCYMISDDDSDQRRRLLRTHDDHDATRL